MNFVKIIIPVAAVALYFVLNIEMGSHIEPDRVVFVSTIGGTYATPSCVATGKVSGPYVVIRRTLGVRA